MKVIWKDIEGYEGYYQVSNLGNVKSVSRIRLYMSGVRPLNEKIIKPDINSEGYCRVTLQKNRLIKKFAVHRLVAIHFIENNQKLPVVRHRDDNPSNNNVHNLLWGTQQDNINDMVSKGRQAKGERGGMYGRVGKMAICYGRTGDKHPMFGKKGEFNKSSKIVLNTQTGIFYYGIREAANSIGEEYIMLFNKLSGRTKNNTSLIYA